MNTLLFVEAKVKKKMNLPNRILKKCPQILFGIGQKNCLHPLLHRRTGRKTDEGNLIG